MAYGSLFYMWIFITLSIWIFYSILRKGSLFKLTQFIVSKILDFYTDLCSFGYHLDHFRIQKQPA